MIRHLGLSIALLAALLTGCDTWKRADMRGGQILAFHVDTIKEQGRDLIRIRGRRSAVLIDPVGAKVVDYHLGRRPRWFFEPEPYRSDRSRIRQVEQPAGPNVLADDGWRTTCEPCAPALREQRYWQVEAAANHVVLLSESRGGLRWRKEFDLDENTGELAIAVMLENTSLRPVEVAAASVVATRGKLTSEGFTQRAWAEGQWFSRRLESPAIGTPFEFPRQTIPPLKKIQWRERWWISPDATATQPSDPPAQRKNDRPRQRP